MSLVTLDQSRSNVGNNQIGIQNNYFGPALQISILRHLEALAKQVKDDEQCLGTIDRLKRYEYQRKNDDVIGLEAKLIKAGMKDELEDAIEKKELFAKRLEAFAHFSSAQEVFACLLSRAEYYFSQFIKPQLGTLTQLDYNLLLDEKVIQPTVADCADSLLTIDHSVAMGMIYWLAERCFIRWHKI